MNPAKPLWRRRQMDGRMKVADLGVDPRIAAILKEQGIEDLYPPQERAAPIALEGKSLVLVIPTASGKSLVAYLAVLKHVLAGGKAMYIVPLRALAAEKYDDLKAFEPLGIKVGISMGDYDSPDPTLARYDVIVSTSERADSLLRHRADWLAKLTVVVADEVHLINDADRGPTLEVTLAKMRQVNPKLQIIALSATIRNSAELAAWLKAEHVWSDWRPVPLRSGVMFNGMVLWTDRKTTEFKATEDDLSGLVKAIVATPTLASGINLPARRVIVRDVTRYDVNLGFTPIPVLEIQQMCGRAGRPRYDPYGEAILLAKKEEEQEYFLEDYLLAPPEPVESKLGAEPALRVHLLAVIATGHCRTVDELYGFLKQTVFAFERDVYDLQSNVEKV